MSTQCTTHHHACDCREAKFKRLLEAAKEVSDVSVSPCGWQELDALAELQQAIKECEK